MEKLIQFLLQNVFLVILLPIVFTWLKRIGQGLLRQEGSPQKPPNRMPSFGGDWAERSSSRKQSGHRPRPQEPRRAEAERQASLAAQKPGDTAESDAPAWAEPPQLNPPAGSGLAVKGDLSAQPAAPQSPPERGIPFDPKHAASGIIWSEVLGPPRAKNPRRKW